MNRTRMARLAGTALLAAGLAVAVMSPVAASAATDQAMSPALLTAMQRDLGLSADQVYARVAQEAQANAAEAKLSGQLGGSFAGSWFDSSAGKLVVAVTDASKVSEITAAGATARVV
jgi:streptogrisin C